MQLCIFSHYSVWQNVKPAFNSSKISLSCTFQIFFINSRRSFPTELSFFHFFRQFPEHQVRTYYEHYSGIKLNLWHTVHKAYMKEQKQFSYHTSRDGDLDKCLPVMEDNKPGKIMAEGTGNPLALSSLLMDATSDILGARSRLVWSSIT